jgi:hypothetical protein
MSTQLTLSDFDATTQTTILSYAIPKIANITYQSGTTASTSGGQTITVSGYNFKIGVTVYIDSTVAPLTTFANSNSLTFTAPAKTAGTKNLYVINPDGRTGQYYYGITYA